MDQTLIFWTIVGMAAVTFIPRLLPTLFLSGRTLKPIIVSWLRLVPPAVLAAMLFPSLLIRDAAVDLRFDNLFLWVGIVAFVVAWKWQSLFATVIVGMGLVALGRWYGVGN